MLKEIVFLLILLRFSRLEVEVKHLDSLFCWSCQGGFKSSCGVEFQNGTWEECGQYASCYEAIISYNNDALILVKRRCFSPPNNDTSINFCNSEYNNPVGRVIDCHSCNSTMCNGHFITPFNYGYNGTFDMNRLKDTKIVSPIFDTFGINDYLEIGN